MEAAPEARKRRRCNWRCPPAPRSCAGRLEGQCAETGPPAQFAEMLINQLPVLRLALLFGLVKARPADEIARLFQFAGAVAMVEIGGEQAVLLLQRRQLFVQPVNVPDDVFAFHGFKIPEGCRLNKPASGAGGVAEEWA